ncbi:MAG TPA: hypothetical protein VK348_11765, partial [Planctomycetota bacterium]|nr:hypothetical protein [Planctomycetota bacterium]
ERMEQQSLPAPAVQAAMRAGGFRSLRIDGFARQDLYRQWIGSGEGMGVCVLDGSGRCYAARPGPQDPPELAAYLALVASRRPAITSARALLVAHADDGAAQLRLGTLLLELGCRRDTERLLAGAAAAGEPEARHQLARLCGLDGRLEEAHHWLEGVERRGQVQVTEGYVLFKERRHGEAVAVLESALRDGERLGDDRQRAQLFLGKALHECARDAEAIPLLQSLAAERLGTTFEGAALHTLAHIQNPDHGHTH